MADVAVVGAGLGGLATAARLAKLGHRVVVLERGPAPGGRLETVRHGEFCWDATPFQTTIPAVLRDLFRKSGRPLERYVDLQLGSPARRHLFADGTRLDLPTGSRGTQLAAVSQAMGERAGQAWTTFVDEQADLWALLRAEVLDRPDGASRLADRRLRRQLRLDRSLNRLLHKAFRDARLRQLAAYPTQRDGDQELADSGLRAVDSYVERTFGVWRLAGGAQELATALMTRMRERSVEVRFDTEVVAVQQHAARVRGVETASGSHVRADWVVTSATKPSANRICHVAIRGDWPDLPAELVLHGDPAIVVTQSGTAPAGHRACSLTVHGGGSADPLAASAGRGLDLRDAVIARVESRPTPHPIPTLAVQDVAGLLVLGAGNVMGESVPYVAWQAAHVAEVIGRP